MAAADYPARQQVTLVEIVELVRPLAEFAGVVEAGVRRLEQEGIASLVRLQFFSTPEDNLVGAILTFADPEEFMTHVRMLAGWDEFRNMLEHVRPVSVRIHGALPAEAEAWLRRAFPEVQTFPDPITGFVR